MRDVSPSLTSNPAAAALDEIVIRPRAGWRLVDLREVWRYRELLWILALRDIKVRYKQTFIGVAWAILQPVTKMVIFTTLFRLIGRTPAEQDVAYPYAVTLYCALLPWELFANALAQSSESIVLNQQLVTKVYFPRVIVPVAPIVAGLLDFALAFLVLIGMMVYYGITPSWQALMLPLFIAFAVAAALSMGLWLSALNALYRDFRYAMPFLIQIGFFISPVIYETQAIIPPPWRSAFALNPMVGVLEGFRWALLGKTEPPLLPMLISAAAVALLLLGGLVYFRRMERLFADRV